VNGIFEHTVTVYNRRPASPPKPGLPPAGQDQWHRTVITGVQWRDSEQTAQNGEGVTVINKTVSITIPEEADCRNKTYVRPSTFAAIPEDRLSGYWTANTDPVNPDIVVLGEGPEIAGAYSVANLERDYRYMRPRQVTDGSHVTDMPVIRIRGV